MNVISWKRIKEFCESRKTAQEQAEAERVFSTWYALADCAEWKNFAELKQTFGSADSVGNCVVFDVGNNNYRLIGRVLYRGRMVCVLDVMDHKTYDKKNWRKSCRCDEPPPKKSPKRG